ncbi:MAG TPA: MFS transporter [Candidatus Eisenbacteria bacterium]|jgi:ACS family tartrate transporter-like MFS transporter|nr:MFS transporter [Candidatus Eisenbacteria bacterium]
MPASIGRETPPSATVRKIALRLLPFLFLLYIVAFLDRVNISFAGLEMTRDLSFSDRVFGLGAGIFFVGYVVFEIPGALLVERWSARKVIARILLTWGMVTVLVALVRTPGQFYIARFLLGAAEAGFFPGVLVYLTHWFRSEDRAKAAAMFMAAIPVANAIGSPLAGVILNVHWAGWPGWRWLFVLEGVPAVILGVVTLYLLPDRPVDARWLAKEEREWIMRELEIEKAAKAGAGDVSIAQALRMPRVVLLTIVYFLSVTGIYGFAIWFPTILKRATSFSNLTVTMLAALPYVAGVMAMLLNGWHSDRTRERRWHTALPLFVGSACLGCALAFSSELGVAFVLMIVVGACTTAFLPSFWPLPSDFLVRSAAAAAIGLINALGNLGGFVGPYAMGLLRSHTGSFTFGLLVLLACMAAAGVLVLFLPAREDSDCDHAMP